MSAILPHLVTLMGPAVGWLRYQKLEKSKKEKLFIAQ